MTENNIWHSKWLRNELPEGEYRIKDLKTGKIHYARHIGIKYLVEQGDKFSMDIEILAPVPSYEEFLSLEQQLQAKEEEIEELKDFVGYCFDLQLRGCSDTEKYEGIKNRADEILKGHENK